MDCRGCTFFAASVGVDVVAFLAFAVGLGPGAGEFGGYGDGDLFAVLLQ